MGTRNVAVDVDVDLDGVGQVGLGSDCPTGMLIDLTDADQVPFPQQILRVAEFDDTFGLFNPSTSTNTTTTSRRAKGVNVKIKTSRRDKNKPQLDQVLLPLPLSTNCGETNVKLIDDDDQKPFPLDALQKVKGRHRSLGISTPTRLKLKESPVDPFSPKFNCSSSSTFSNATVDSPSVSTPSPTDPFSPRFFTNRNTQKQSSGSGGGNDKEEPKPKPQGQEGEVNSSVTVSVPVDRCVDVSCTESPVQLKPQPLPLQDVKYQNPISVSHPDSDSVPPRKRSSYGRKSTGSESDCSLLDVDNLSTFSISDSDCDGGVADDGMNTSTPLDKIDEEPQPREPTNLPAVVDDSLPLPLNLLSPPSKDELVRLEELQLRPEITSTVIANTNTLNQNQDQSTATAAANANEVASATATARVEKRRRDSVNAQLQRLSLLLTSSPVRSRTGSSISPPTPINNTNSNGHGNGNFLPTPLPENSTNTLATPKPQPQPPREVATPTPKRPSLSMGMKGSGMTSPVSSRSKSRAGADAAIVRRMQQVPHSPMSSCQRYFPSRTELTARGSTNTNTTASARPTISENNQNNQNTPDEEALAHEESVESVERVESVTESESEPSTSNIIKRLSFGSTSSVSTTATTSPDKRSVAVASMPVQQPKPVAAIRGAPQQRMQMQPPPLPHPQFQAVRQGQGVRPLKATMPMNMTMTTTTTNSNSSSGREKCPSAPVTRKFTPQNPIRTPATPTRNGNGGVGMGRNCPSPSPAGAAEGGRPNVPLTPGAAGGGGGGGRTPGRRSFSGVRSSGYGQSSFNTSIGGGGSAACGRNNLQLESPNSNYSRRPVSAQSPSVRIPASPRLSFTPSRSRPSSASTSHRTSSAGPGHQLQVKSSLNQSTCSSMPVANPGYQNKLSDTSTSSSGSSAAPTVGIGKENKNKTTGGISSLPRFGFAYRK